MLKAYLLSKILMGGPSEVYLRKTEIIIEPGSSLSLAFRDGFLNTFCNMRLTRSSIDVVEIHTIYLFSKFIRHSAEFRLISSKSIFRRRNF